MFTIKIATPDDFHLHLRDGAMLGAVARHVGPWARVLIMPNLAPDPILTGVDAAAYKQRVLKAFEKFGIQAKPLMTIQLTESTTPEMIHEASEAGVIAAKVYPRGQTTNSDNGVLDYKALEPALVAMRDLGMVLCLHGETPEPGVFCLDREQEFLAILDELITSVPELKIVLEHVTTAAAVNKVLELPEHVAATITLHHLMITLDDVVGDKLQPHHFCKPIAKRESDRLALVKAATSGNPKFFFGSDSAPHLKGDKECSSGCAGVFTAPVALPLLVEVFEANKALYKVEDFVSRNGPMFYGLPFSEGEVTLRKEPLVVRKTYDGVVPFYAGKEISWQVVD